MTVGDEAEGRATAPARRRAESLAELAVVAASYLAALAALSWPWFSRLASEAPAGGDGGTFVWGFWWMRRALETAVWPLSTQHMFAPYGVNLGLHTGMPLLAVASIPIQWVAGPVVAYNVMVIVTYVLSGCCAYLLARDVGLDRAPAWFAGLAFAFAPAVSTRALAMDHLNLAQVYWIPLTLLVLRRWLRDPQPRRALVLGTVGGLALLSDVTITVFAALAAGAYVIGYLVARRSEIDSDLVMAVVRGVVITVAFGLLVALPLLTAVAHGVLARAYGDSAGLAGSPSYSVDAAALWVPSQTHPFLGEFGTRWHARMSSGREGPTSVGVVVGILAVAGAAGAWRRPVARWLALLAVAAILLSLGPLLHVFGSTYVPLAVTVQDVDGPRQLSGLLPYTWFQQVPLLSSLRAPQRMLLLAALPLALLAGWAVQTLRRSSRLLVLAVLTPLVLLEGASRPLAVVPADAPAVYDPVRADPDPDVIVLDVPFGLRTGLFNVGHQRGAPMIYGTLHGKRLASGFVTRASSARLQELASLPLYRDVLALQEHDPATPPPPVNPGEGAASALANRIRWVVVQSDEVPGLPLLQPYLESACFDLVTQDGPALLYRLDEACPEPVTND